MLRPLLVVLLAYSSGFGQEVAIKTQLRAGDTFVVESLRSREDSQRPQTNRKTLTKIDYRVEQVDEKAGLLLDVVVGEGEVLEPAAGLNPIVQQLSKAAAAIHYKVRLNPGGNYKGVENEEEAGKQLLAVVDELRKAILAEIPEAQREATDRAMRATMQPSAIIASALEDVTLYFKLHGGSLPTNRPVAASVSQPSPLNGAAIPAEMKIEVVKVSAAEANVTLQTKPNSEALTALTKQLLSQMAPEVAANARNVTIQVQDDAAYRLDRAIGLMSQVDMTRTMTVGPQVRKDTWVLKLVSSPKR